MWFASQGFVAEHVYDCGMETETDLEVWHHALTTDAVIVTKDEDFVRFAIMSADGPRVVWLRIGNSTNRRLLAWMDRAWPAIVEALNADERLIEASPST